MPAASMTMSARCTGQFADIREQARGMPLVEGGGERGGEIVDALRAGARCLELAEIEQCVLTSSISRGPRNRETRSVSAYERWPGIARYVVQIEHHSAQGDAAGGEPVRGGLGVVHDLRAIGGKKLAERRGILGEVPRRNGNGVRHRDGPMRETPSLPSTSTATACVSAPSQEFTFSIKVVLVRNAAPQAPP